MKLIQEVKPILVLIQAAASAVMLPVWLFGDVSFLGVTVMICAIVALVSIILNTSNLLFFARTVFIVWIGFIPALSLYMGGYFAWRMPFVQTPDVAFIMTIITVFSLFSSQIGIEAGKKLRAKSYGVDLPGNERIMIYFFLFLVFVTGTLIALSRGPLIFEIDYGVEGRRDMQVDMPLHNLQSIAILLMMFCLILYFRLRDSGKLTKRQQRNLLYLILLTGGYLALWCQFLRGARMDPLTLIFGMAVLTVIYKKANLRLSRKMLVFLLFGFFIIQIWGGVRQNFSLSTMMDGSRLIKIGTELYQSSGRDGVPVYFRQGTMNNLSLSVATMIYAIEKGELTYRYGSSYIDYIARTPPAFIYPDRPKSLAWLSDELYGDGGAGGGFNEMAEAFLNFGVFGSLIVPAVVSFLLSYSFKQFMVNRYNIIRSLLFTSMLAVFFRGLLYQSFTFYKTFVTAVILYGVFLFLYNLLLSNRLVRRRTLAVQGSTSITWRRFFPA